MSPLRPGSLSQQSNSWSHLKIRKNICKIIPLKLQRRNHCKSTRSFETIFHLRLTRLLGWSHLLPFAPETRHLGNLGTPLEHWSWGSSDSYSSRRHHPTWSFQSTGSSLKGGIILSNTSHIQNRLQPGENLKKNNSRS